MFASIFSLRKLSLPLMGSHSGEDVTRRLIGIQVGIAMHSRRELSCRALGGHELWRQYKWEGAALSVFQDILEVAMCFRK